MKMSLLQRCGHVFCQNCADIARKDECCPDCGADARPVEIIPLQVGGTGFTSGGAHIAKSKVTPSFQCF